jgi:hypothetical protein
MLESLKIVEVYESYLPCLVKVESVSLKYDLPGSVSLNEVNGGLLSNMRHQNLVVTKSTYAMVLPLVVNSQLIQDLSVINTLSLLTGVRIRTLAPLAFIAIDWPMLGAILSPRSNTTKSISAA